MSGPENKQALQAPTPEEQESQKLEEVLVTSKRLIAEMEALMEATRKTLKRHEELIAGINEERAKRQK